MCIVFDVAFSFAKRNQNETRRAKQKPPKTQTTAGASLRLPVDGCFSKHIASFAVQLAAASRPASGPHPAPSGRPQRRS